MSKRLKFFVGHLSISLLFILLLAVLVFLVWFIPPLHKAMGVLPIFTMLVIIDLLVGPLLGFFVYKEGKKTLKFDLSVVILLQAGLLLYGTHIIMQARPTWIVYNSGILDVVQSFELNTENIDKAKPEFQRIPWFYPQFAAVTPLPNSERFIELQSGMFAVQKPERYYSFSEAKPQIQQSAQALQVLGKFNNKTNMDKILAKYPQADAWLPLRATSVDMTVLINKDTGEVVKIVDLRPWK